MTEAFFVFTFLKFKWDSWLCVRFCLRTEYAYVEADRMEKITFNAPIPLIIEINIKNVQPFFFCSIWFSAVFLMYALINACDYMYSHIHFVRIYGKNKIVPLVRYRYVCVRVCVGGWLYSADNFNSFVFLCSVGKCLSLTHSFYTHTYMMIIHANGS